jgi:predicted unusual protein kinase regulating ubiquinone biosynthesis (AarF/ABC1/UbiB family)
MGKRVAIKIQHPRLQDIYNKDLAIMQKIARVVRFFGRAGWVGGVEQSWGGIIRNAGLILYHKINYRIKAINAVRFGADFDIGIRGDAVEMGTLTLNCSSSSTLITVSLSLSSLSSTLSSLHLSSTNDIIT